MKYMRLFLSLLLLTMLHGGIRAQDALDAAGGEATGLGGAASYSVGQLAIQTYATTGFSIAEGVQQPYEISMIVGIPDDGIELKVAAYPNPVRDYLRLSVLVWNDEAIDYRLRDMAGRELFGRHVLAEETDIHMADLPNATYFLTISSDQKPIKIFKIVKL